MNAVTQISMWQQLAQSNQWFYLWPEIALTALGLATLLFEMVFPRRLAGKGAPALAMTGYVVIAACVLTPLYPANAPDITVFNGMLLAVLNRGITLFFLASAFLTAFLAVICLRRQTAPRAEYFAILSFATAAMLVLARANNFLLMFVALETVTVALYVMVGYARNRLPSLEAALKYLVTGAMSSGLLLFGIALLYGFGALSGCADPLDYAQLQAALSAADAAKDPLVLCGIALVLCGIAFKLGAFPFQIWIPDVYQGALTPTTAFLAVSSKAVGFIVLINLLIAPFVAESLQALLIPLLSAVAALTILFGNLAALSQRNLKRLMGLSGVSHAGYLMIGVVAFLCLDQHYVLYAIAFYLLAYLLASYAVFGVMAYMAGENDEKQEFHDYRLLIERRSYLACVLFMGVGSLAGIPPMAGFIGKLLIFICAVEAQLYGLLAVGIFGVVVSIYYYFGWLRAAAFRPGRTKAHEPSAPLPEAPSTFGRVVLGALAVAVLVLGLYQGSLIGASAPVSAAEPAASAESVPAPQK